MKVLILAGGYGTRLAEETDIRPKPMVEIGGMPILWHIMKIYSHYGFNEFVVLLGYKSYYIKEYFANYFLHKSDVTIDLRTGELEVHSNASEDWRITLLDTGVDTMTGGRVKRAQAVIGNDPFMLTYGDGVGDVDIGKLVSFHRAQGRIATMTCVQPEGRFGAIEVADSNRITTFIEKPRGDGNWINAGFFVCEPSFFDYIASDDSVILEQEPLRKLAGDGQLSAFKHHGFWKPMDALRDKQQLQSLWEAKRAPWKVW